MTLPRWLDEHGKLMVTRPCPRCGTPVPVGRTFRLEHVKAEGIRLTSDRYVT
jgi:hypothetical protein